MAIKRPYVEIQCPADHFHGPGERIIEFSFPDGTGGLISFRAVDGKNTVVVYRTDPSVQIIAPNEPK